MIFLLHYNICNLLLQDHNAGFFTFFLKNIKDVEKLFGAVFCENKCPPCRKTLRKEKGILPPETP